MTHLKLVDLIKQHALQFGDFELSGGGRSSYFIDMSKVTNHSSGLDLICSEIARSIKADAVGGPVLGAAPLVGGTLMAYERLYFGMAKPLRGFLVRKEPKIAEPGTVSPVYFIEGSLEAGDEVVVVEDVVTTGKQTLRAIQCVEAVGAKVVGVYAVFDRLAGAAELLGRYDFKALVTIDDLDIGKQA